MSRGKQPRAKPLGAPVPPPDPRPYVPQITLPANRETAFMALHASVVGFGMHWLENQHYPHRRDSQWCQGCRCGLSVRWEGYIGVISLATLNRFVLRLPAAAFRNSGQFRDRSDAGTLTSLVFTAYRFGSVKAKTNPAVIEVLNPVLPPPVSRPFPLLAALSRYWRMESMADVDQVQRPEDIEAALANRFTEFQERIRDQQREWKGGKP